MKTRVVIFPFDLFGGGGAGAGAELIGDELREVLADNRRERTPTRARAYAGQVQLRSFSFETVDHYADWRRQGRQAVRQALRQGDFLVWVAGNHLGALPVFDELSALGPGTLVVQLDAHLDIHHFSDLTTAPSHGNFLRHCAGPLPPLVNAGHRELLLTPDHVAGYYRRTFPASELAVDPTPALAELRALAGAAERVFFDLDWDVLDPAYFPAVSRPAPFGLSPALLLRLIDAAWSPKAAGLLLSEFDPGRDRDDRSLAIALWLLEFLLLRKYEAASPRLPAGPPPL
jgi:arginase family enzyme